MEDPNKDQGYRKLSRICELLQMIHLKLQLHSKATKQTEEKERMGVERRTPTSLWGTQGQDNKSTSTLSFKERRKI